MKEATVRKDSIVIEGGTIDIVLLQDEDGTYFIEIDGVKWCDTDSIHHAVILFELLHEHVTEKMKYVKTR